MTNISNILKITVTYIKKQKEKSAAEKANNTDEHAPQM